MNRCSLLFISISADFLEILYFYNIKVKMFIFKDKFKATPICSARLFNIHNIKYISVMKNLDLIFWESKVDLNSNKREFCYLIASRKVSLRKVLDFQSFVTRKLFSHFDILVEKKSRKPRLLIDEKICRRKSRNLRHLVYTRIYICSIFAYFTTLERLSIRFLYKSSIVSAGIILFVVFLL